MKKYRDIKTGKRVVEVDDLSFISDRNHRYNWLQRHYHHRRLKRALRKADVIIASGPKTAFDIHRYYFIREDRISVRG